ncbi:unnamed protein product [Pedinophyceae sp. YPF-701]|nr:unnamed protein product [Pedinophyceae sp. YPF-701]
MVRLASIGHSLVLLAALAACVQLGAADSHTALARARGRIESVTGNIVDTLAPLAERLESLEGELPGGGRRLRMMAEAPMMEQAPDMGSILISEPAEDPVLELVDEAPCRTVADVAMEYPVLLAAVQRAGLAETLADPELEATVFVPTDEAFAALLEAKGLAQEDLLASENLADILKYHVIAGVAAKAEDLSMGQMLASLQGGELAVMLGEDGGVTLDGAASDALVTVANVAACKAIVHVVDTVLLPFEL